MKPKIKVNPLKTQMVIDLVKGNIQQNQLKPGDRLPSLNELSKFLDVSPSVVYRGLLALVEEGMLECQGTRGFFVPEKEDFGPKENTEVSPKNNDRVYLSIGHHSDFTWHWTFETYDEIRRKQLDEMAERLEKYPDMCAYVEQAGIMEKYFRTCPGKKAVFQRAFDEGRFTPMGGYLIPDLNMSSGELLVRNLQKGRAIYQKLFGKEPDAACESDAFGMCSQLPQVLLKSGFKFLSPGRLAGLTLPRNRAFRWCGADGSVIPVMVWNHNVVHNCLNCNWVIVYDPAETLEETLKAVINNEQTGPLLVHSETEVDHIPEDLFAIIDRANRRSKGRRIDFGSIADYFHALDIESLPVFSGELNPVFTGCYTTRCGIKQRFRQAENRLFTVEMLSALVDRDVDLSKEILLLIECSFHDALCGCHTDIVNAQLNEKYDEAAEGFDRVQTELLKELKGTGVFNPGPEGKQLFSIESSEDFALEGVAVQREGDRLYAVADLPGYGVAGFKKIKAACNETETPSAQFETEYFKVDFSTPSPVIVSKKTGKKVSAAETQFGELFVRADYGTMWTERLKSKYYDQSFATEKVVSITSGPVMITVVTEGEFDQKMQEIFCNMKGLSFRKEFRFFRELDYFTLKITLNYTGKNNKIVVRFPVEGLDVMNAQSIFSVPFGSQVRQPCFEVEKKYESTLHMLAKQDYVHAAGDFPALGWVDYSDLATGLAVANRGTVGHQCVNGYIYASLLRSGTMIDDGNMTPEPLAMDNGIKTFEFAIQPHSGSELECAASLGERFNHVPVFFDNQGKNEKRRSLPVFDKNNITVSSIRKCEDGIIIRAFETFGRKTQCKLDTENSVCFESDLQEKQWKIHKSSTWNFAPWEIKTIKVQF